MRIILDLTATSSNRLEGTASWAGVGQPVAFNGYLGPGMGPAPDRSSSHSQATERRNIMRNLWKRTTVIVLTVGGFIALSATAADAGVVLGNHCEP